MYGRRPGWHIPERYRDSQKISKEFLLLYFAMPVLVGISLIIAPFLQIDVRTIYSEVYVYDYSVTAEQDSIILLTSFGILYDNDKTPFECTVENKDNDVIVGIQTPLTFHKPKMPETIQIDVPINSTSEHIIIEQRNGFRQLVLEKDKDTSKWMPASEWSRLLFFAQEYPLLFSLACVIGIVFIAIGVILIRKITLKMRQKKYQDKDPFTDEL